ncbi:hypothetical protein GN956_G24384 [Arapaima gigas]
MKVSALVWLGVVLLSPASAQSVTEGMLHHDGQLKGQSSADGEEVGEETALVTLEKGGPPGVARVNRPGDGGLTAAQSLQHHLLHFKSQFSGHHMISDRKVDLPSGKFSKLHHPNKPVMNTPTEAN